jgi:transcriptional regulator with XRE-family HTH domain
MVDYKRILRLRAEGVSQRGIADVMGCSRNTVAAVFSAANAASIGFEQVTDLAADEVRRLLLPEPVRVDSDRVAPDFERVHRELARPSVTLLLRSPSDKRSRSSRQFTCSTGPRSGRSIWACSGLVCWRNSGRVESGPPSVWKVYRRCLVGDPAYTRRLADPLLSELVAAVPSVMVTGPRAAGKTRPQRVRMNFTPKGCSILL